jgi:replicative DNA helicase
MTATRNQRDTKQLAPPAPFPINADAERSVLGAVLLEPSLLATCTDAGLSREHFGLSSHAEIYSVLLRMDAEGKPIDTLLLREEMDVSRIGGIAYLSYMQSEAIAIACHVRERCKIVVRNFQLRQLLAIADRVDFATRQRGASPQQIAQQAIKEMEAVGCNR